MAHASALRTPRLLAVAVLFSGAAAAAEPAISFTRDIKGILSNRCVRCHGPDAEDRHGGGDDGLRLDTFAGATADLGGHAAIVPGKPDDSELLARITSTDPDVVMPPPEAGERLSPAEVERLTRWIAGGAAYEPHWAYVAPKRPPVPAVKNAGWPRNDIDRFILARLEAEGLGPQPEADRSTLARRLALDLTGLPLSPEEVDAFVADPAPDAVEKLVDRLLAHDGYGEHAARQWLDLARYADSAGYADDRPRTIWGWRDWVIRACDANMPFDEFTIRQLAGDLLPDATDEDRIATGFHRNTLTNSEGGTIDEEFRVAAVVDRVNTTMSTWMGTTMACAQCHDHKYDPLTQADYYSLLDAFNRVPESGTPQYFSSRIRVAAPFIEVPGPDVTAHIDNLQAQINAADAEARPIADAAFEGWRQGLLTDGKPAEGKGLPEPVVALLAKPEAERSEDEKKQLEASLRKHFEEKIRGGLAGKLPVLTKADPLRRQLNDFRADRLPRVMVMSDAQPRPTHILDRGEYLKPTEKVSFRTPGFLPAPAEGTPANRLGLAQWLVSEQQPLTMRVHVNRLWQHLFGVGLVKTAEDFGVQSEFPVHRELLDWLAVEFRRQGFSHKRFLREVVRSATYRQASKVPAEVRQRDPENRLLGRAGRFRMPSLLLRDWALAAAGVLDPRVGGQPVYPYQPDAVWEALAITKERDFTYPASQGSDLYRRSLYTFWRRTVGPTNMFDASNRQTCRVRLSNTSTPLHALTTLNDPTWVEAARLLAERVTGEAPEVDRRLELAFHRVVCRAPSATDLAVLKRAYGRQLARFQQSREQAEALLKVGASPRNAQLDAAESAALTAVCLAILNLDESLTRE